MMRKIRPHHIISALALSGIIFAGLSGGPVFSGLDQFVLVAEDKIHIADSAQISSGDIASNKEISIAENSIINGNLFSDNIKIAENAQINGTASFNKLKLAQNSNILGEQKSPISLPIIQLPEIPDFPTGTEKLKIDQDQTINAGNFDEIEVKENTTLTLNPGIYNFNKLELRENSKLIFSGKTTINITEELKINQKVLIAPNANIPATDLEINFAGEKSITIGEESFISAKLLAPKSKVYLGERITFRGQILAREIKIGKESILSRENFFSKESDPESIVVDQDNSKFLVDEILINFTDGATLSDAQSIASFVGGRVVGFVGVANIYQIEVFVAAPGELESKIQAIRQMNNPLVEGVSRNYLIRLLFL